MVGTPLFQIAPSGLIPRVLLTNDDGITAPGLKLLEEIAGLFAEEVWVVAPASDQSGTGQNVTLHKPIRCRQQSPRRWAVEGTPGDCVALAATEIMRESPPSLVLSGVNAGANLGDEINMSGTAGAALTALMLGLPAMAISQAAPARHYTPWATAREVLPKILKCLLSDGWSKDCCLCVNIPPVPPDEIKGLRWARQGSKNIKGFIIERHVAREDEGDFWLGLDRTPPLVCEACDSATLWRGDVSVTAIGLDRSRETPGGYISFEPDANPPSPHG